MEHTGGRSISKTWELCILVCLEATYAAMPMAQVESMCHARNDHSLVCSLLPSRVQEEVRGGAWLVPGGDRGLLHRGEQRCTHGRDGVGEWLFCRMPREGSPGHGLDSRLSTERGLFLPAHSLLPCPASWTPASCTAPAQWFLRHMHVSQGLWTRMSELTLGNVLREYFWCVHPKTCIEMFLCLTLTLL